MKARVLFFQMQRLRHEQMLHREDINAAALEAMEARGLVTSARRGMVALSDYGYEMLEDAEIQAGALLFGLPVRSES